MMRATYRTHTRGRDTAECGPRGHSHEPESTRVCSCCPTCRPFPATYSHPTQIDDELNGSDSRFAMSLHPRQKPLARLSAAVASLRERPWNSGDRRSITAHYLSLR
eukprot:1344944-Prymnesium_polylepis.1